MDQTNEQTTKCSDSTFESIIIDIPQNLTFSSASASSSSYDTDSSVNSATCCTKHIEHNYMQKPVAQPLPLPLSLAHKQQLDRRQQSSDLKSSSKIEIEDVYFKADHRKSWPIFMLLISLLETAVFIYDNSRAKNLPPYAFGIDDNSVLIYSPQRRLEAWRFISYMFLHANWFHLSFNVVVQLFYGIPLEVMHGSLRVAVIYFAGVFAGSLGTSVVESNVSLLGASGGVYAILAANFANLTLNYGQMKYAGAQLYSVVTFILCDLAQILCMEFFGSNSNHNGPPVSYVAHITGSLAGFTIGILVLKSFEHRTYENLIWWLALGIYCAFTIFAIVFNLVNTVTAQRMEEEGKVITQHLLHDLGVS